MRAGKTERLKNLTTEASYQDHDFVLGDNKAKVWPRERPIADLSSPWSPPPVLARKILVSEDTFPRFTYSISGAGGGEKGAHHISAWGFYLRGLG